jgi:hypothetical protein
MERRGLPGLRTSVRSEWVSGTLAGLRLGGGEHAGLAAADDRIASPSKSPPPERRWYARDLNAHAES